MELWKCKKCCMNPAIFEHSDSGMQTRASLEILRNGQAKGITGTAIKDTWMKSRGRMEVGSAGMGWREGEKRHTTVIE